MVQVWATLVLWAPGVGNYPEVDNSEMVFAVVHLGKRGFFLPAVIKPEEFKPGAANGHSDTQWRPLAFDWNHHSWK